MFLFTAKSSCGDRRRRRNHRCRDPSSPASWSKLKDPALIEVARGSHYHCCRSSGTVCVHDGEVNSTRIQLAVQLACQTNTTVPDEPSLITELGDLTSTSSVMSPHHDLKTLPHDQAQLSSAWVSNRAYRNRNLPYLDYLC